MILVPYFIDRVNPNWLKLNIFLRSGGRETWSEDGTDKAIQKMLKENGFPVLNIKREQGVIYAQIDNSKLLMDDFYKWDEIDPKVSEEDVWRTFLIPSTLWTCPVFKENFWKTSGLPPVLSSFFTFTTTL
jgi:hypothetical protein